MTKKISPLVKGLKAVRELLAKPERWTKDAYARDADGARVEATDPRATCWCLSGAITKVTPDHATGVPVWMALSDETERARGGAVVGFWNDRPRRTHAQVLRLIDRAIARAEKATP